MKGERKEHSRAGSAVWKKLNMRDKEKTVV